MSLLNFLFLVISYEFLLTGAKIHSPVKGNALQFYKCENGKCNFNSDIAREVFLKAKDKSIAIYSITGKYGSGKSFLLSVFLKYLMFGGQENWIEISAGGLFQPKDWEQNVSPGIWIWSEPIIRKNRNGRDVAIFLLKSQVWQSEQANFKENELVYSLTFLMNSFTILNVEKRIGEEDLHMFQSLSSFARSQINHEPLQRLMFLIRNWKSTSTFKHGYYDEKTSIDGQNYKISKFNPEPDQQLLAKTIRELIDFSFENISAYLMPDPEATSVQDNFVGKTVKQSSEHFISGQKIVNSLFIENLEHLSSVIFDKQEIELKSIGGKLINGLKMAHFIEKLKIRFEIDFTSLQKREIEERPYLLVYSTAIDYFHEKININLKIIENNKHIKALKFKLMESGRSLIKRCKMIFNSSLKLQDEKLLAKYATKLAEELDESLQFYKNSIETEIQDFKPNYQIISSFRQEKKKQWFEYFMGILAYWFKLYEIFKDLIFNIFRHPN